MSLVLVTVLFVEIFIPLPSPPSNTDTVGVCGECMLSCACSSLYIQYRTVSRQVSVCCCMSLMQ